MTELKSELQRISASLTYDGPAAVPGFAYHEVYLMPMQMGHQASPGESGIEPSAEQIARWADVLRKHEDALRDVALLGSRMRGDRRGGPARAGGGLSLRTVPPAKFRPARTDVRVPQ